MSDIQISGTVSVELKTFREYKRKLFIIPSLCLAPILCQKSHFKIATRVETPLTSLISEIGMMGKATALL